MHDAPPSDPTRPDEPSLLTLRLKETLGDEPPPPPLPPDEAHVLAQALVDTQLKTWRLGALLGTGPVTAAYEASRGVKDASERGVLKLMIGTMAKHPRARTLFIRAAYAANRFNHPRVLSITEDGRDAAGAPFVVRPWVEATSLSSMVERGKLDEQQVLRIAEQVLDAIEMAHAHGIVHGAINPENILITPRGSIRLCDFATPPGLGTPTRPAEDDLIAVCHVGPFSAPERCQEPPQVASEASDIYSVAACMYFALSQRPPRGLAMGPAELRTAKAVPLREMAPDVSEPLCSVIDHAINFDPLRRYESAYAMLGDVRRVMAGRKPKLVDAVTAVPSASHTHKGAPPSGRGPSSVRGFDSYPPRNAVRTGSHPPGKHRDEWRGNLLLILAIATIVGVATFVLVREKMADQKPPADSRGGGQAGSGVPQ